MGNCHNLKKDRRPLSYVSKHKTSQFCEGSRKLSYSNLHPMLPDTCANEESIFKYLLKNPLFLDSFIKKRTTISRLQQWMKVKLSDENIDLTKLYDDKNNRIDLQIKHVHTLVKSLYFPSYPLPEEVEYLTKTMENNVTRPPDKIQCHFFPYSEIVMSETNLVFIYMIQDLFGVEAFPKKIFFNFLERIKINYFNVPFHNYKHAIGHAQTMYWIFKNNKIPIFSELDMKTLMISSLAHDLGHPGFGEFLSSQTYNSTFSVPYIEKRHSQLLFLILLDDDYNIFLSLSGPAFSKVIINLKSCILAPHINNYSTVVRKFRHMFRNTSDLKKDDNKGIIMDFLMIICELSVSWKTWPIHKKAMIALHQELTNQAEKVELLATDLREMLIGEGFTNLKDFATDFLSKLSIPLLEETLKIFPCFREPLCEAKSNLQKWFKN